MAAIRGYRHPASPINIGRETTDSKILYKTEHQQHGLITRLQVSLDFSLYAPVAQLDRVPPSEASYHG